jgi:hypothetical protein
MIDNNIAGQDGSMYADMMRRMQQKDVEKKKKEVKAAIALAADSEVFPIIFLSLIDFLEIYHDNRSRS